MAKDNGNRKLDLTDEERREVRRFLGSGGVL